MISRSVVGRALPSNPVTQVRFQAGSGILISILGLGCVSFVFYPVLSQAVALTFC